VKNKINTRMITMMMMTTMISNNYCQNTAYKRINFN